jgi:CelD/BcsL family acetyltransferase involved in cellulose biosynthesis
LIDPPERKMRMQYFYLNAYSMQHARLSPGTLVIAMAIEHAAREGIRTIDLLRGNETYKQYWHPQKVPTYGVVLQNPSIHGTARRTSKL